MRVDDAYDALRLYNVAAGLLTIALTLPIYPWWVRLESAVRLYVTGAMILVATITAATVEALIRDTPQPPGLRVALSAAALTYMLIAELIVIWREAGSSGKE